MVFILFYGIPFSKIREYDLCHTLLFMPFCNFGLQFDSLLDKKKILKNNIISYNPEHLWPLFVKIEKKIAVQKNKI